jgi:peptidyl-prolyl cis-trans isomerase D
VLESILKKFSRVVLGVIIAMLTLVFVIQFGGPQSQGCDTQSVQPAAEVYGEQISRPEFKAAYLLAGGDRFPPELAKQQKLEEMVLYGLIERKLLAKKALELGHHTSEDDVMRRVTEDGIVHLSVSVNAGPYLPPSGPQRFDFKDKDGKFSSTNLKNFINYRLHRSVSDFARNQIEESLAQSMRDDVTSSVVISPDELWEAYVREQENVVLRYVRYSPIYYRQQLKLDQAELAAWIAAHQAEVDAEYEKQKHRYTGLEKQVRAQHILIKVDSAADEATKAEKRAQIDALLARAKKGEDFEALAREHSEDTGSAKQGGDLGFNPRGRMVKPFDDAQFALAAGQLSEVVESTFGFHIIKAVAIREGDVPVGEAKRELAEGLYLSARSNELAEKAAGALQTELKAGKSMDQVETELSAAGAGATPAEGEAAAAADPLAPQVRETRAFGREDTPIPGPFDSMPLVAEAFRLSDAAPLPDKPIKLGEDWFVYRLSSRTRAEREAFTESEQERLRNVSQGRKQREALINYVRVLVREAQDKKQILVDTSILDGSANLAAGES